MVRISDARMSGTSHGTTVLHVAPESFVGGPLALVRDGDIIELDVPGRRLELLVTPEEWQHAAKPGPSPRLDSSVDGAPFSPRTSCSPTRAVTSRCSVAEEGRQSRPSSIERRQTAPVSVRSASDHARTRSRRPRSDGWCGRYWVLRKAGPRTTRHPDLLTALHLSIVGPFWTVTRGVRSGRFPLCQEALMLHDRIKQVSCAQEISRQAGGRWSPRFQWTKPADPGTMLRPIGQPARRARRTSGAPLSRLRASRSASARPWPSTTCRCPSKRDGCLRCSDPMAQARPRSSGS